MASPTINKKKSYQNNKPIEIWSLKVFEQKLDYIHQNPVKRGFVDEAVHWRYSSARNYLGYVGLLHVCTDWN